MRFQRVNLDPVGFSRLVKEPAFRVFLSKDEITEFYQTSGFSTPINLGKRIAIGVYKGICKSGGHSITITDISISDHEVLVKTDLREPEPWEASIAIMTSPSDLVMVDRKHFKTGGLFKFKFIDLEGNILHETEVLFPKS